MSEKRNAAIGYSATVLSAVLFSIKGIIAKKAYAAGATPETLLGLRFGFCLPVFGWIAMKSPEAGGLSSLSRADWMRAGFVTALGYVLASLLDFHGLRYISVGLERVILYIHPTIVVLLAVWLKGRPLRHRTVIALLVSYVGLAFCFAGEIHSGNPEAMFRGVAFVFGSALAYAFFMLGAEDLVPRVGVHRLTAIGMLLAGLIFGVQAGVAAGGTMLHLPHEVYMWSLVMAVLSTVLPVYLFGVGFKIMGASRLSIASMAGPVAVLPLSAMFLGEPAGILQWTGFALTLGGECLLLRGRK